MTDDLLAIAQSNDYETVDDYLADAAFEVMSRIAKRGYRISKEDALLCLTDSDGDIDNAVWHYIHD